jgi:glycosyltransferase involved in cell wall biosynthesis
MEELAQRLGILQHFQFLGELPSGKAVREQLDQATLFLMPSRTARMPREMVEAMPRALPGIGTRVGGIPELLHEKEARV